MNDKNKTKIRNYALTIGIDDIGFAKAEAFDSNIELKLFFKDQWKPTKIFNNPLLVHPWAKTIVVGILNYKSTNITLTNKFGRIASYTSKNFYYLLRKKLNSLAKILKNKYHIKTSKIYTNGPFNEKEYAYRAGLGYYGKNNLLINNKFGSLFVIGLFFIDKYFSPDNIKENKCQSCLICEKRCPTKALKNNKINRKICIQELSQKLIHIPDNIKEKWGNRFYGCEECNINCKKNLNVEISNHNIEKGDVGNQIDLINFLELNEFQRKKIFVGNQISSKWIDPLSLIRNALIVLGNNKCKDAENKIINYLNHSNNIIKETAQWSLKKINE